MQRAVTGLLSLFILYHGALLLKGGREAGPDPPSQAAAQARPEDPSSSSHGSDALAAILQKDAFRTGTGAAIFRAQVPEDPDSKPSATAPYILRGTVALGAGKGWVLVAPKGGGDEELVTVGESPSKWAAKLAEVERRSAVFEANGQRTTLEIEEDLPVSSLPAVATEDGVRSLGANRYAIRQSLLDEALGNLSDLVRQMRVTPEKIEGKDAGFRITRLRPQSLFATLGLQVGDILQRINGHELQTPEDALWSLRNLRQVKDLSVDLLRDGQPTTLSYSVEE